MSEQILQLTTKVNIITELITKGTESPITGDNERTESSMHGVNVNNSDDLYVQQGAKPKKMPADIRQATCHVEGKELDEHSAVQSLSEDNHNLSSDLCFNIISAEQKCLLLQLEVSSNIFEDTESFRMALRALIFQIARAGKININKPSTMTMELIFKNDLTKDDIKVIQAISNHSVSPPMIDERHKFPAMLTVFV
ncbi:uncharacterized protein LOC127723815 [Mytilus californianus]|uniref:uncharacterized protein LOC127723815 n=1 Tax=Mytilus californianus TaxID=6549 RepID=UPI002246E4D1|nr:uncharacterized protein LOC127723815 [Mytilus californianus]